MPYVMLAEVCIAPCEPKQQGKVNSSRYVSFSVNEVAEHTNSDVYSVTTRITYHRYNYEEITHFKAMAGVITASVTSRGHEMKTFLIYANQCHTSLYLNRPKCL